MAASCLPQRSPVRPPAPCPTAAHSSWSACGTSPSAPGPPPWCWPSVPPAAERHLRGAVGPDSAGLSRRPCGKRRGPSCSVAVDAAVAIVQHDAAAGMRGGHADPAVRRPSPWTGSYLVSPVSWRSWPRPLLRWPRPASRTSARLSAVRLARGRRAGSAAWLERFRCPTPLACCTGRTSSPPRSSRSCISSGHLIGGKTQARGLRALVFNRPADDVVGVTGPVPARYDQSKDLGGAALPGDIRNFQCVAHPGSQGASSYRTSSPDRLSHRPLSPSSRRRYTS